MIRFCHKAFVHALLSSIAFIIIGVFCGILGFYGSGSATGLAGLFVFLWPACLLDGCIGLSDVLGTGSLNAFFYVFFSWIVWLGILYVTFSIIHGIKRNKSNKNRIASDLDY